MDAIPEYAAYLTATFGHEDDVLQRARQRMADGGLPSIQVSASEGAVLRWIVQVSGARRILEIGTLGGYSAIWIARGMPAGGRLISLELEEHHAEVARANWADAGLSEVAEVRVGPAASTLRTMPETDFDLVFIDADKPGYPEYLELSLPKVRAGGLILADNTLNQDAARGEGPAYAYNQLVRENAGLVSALLPMLRSDGLDGLTVSVKR
jgi:caffeoyl-CoA O-methyltransferase